MQAIGKLYDLWVLAHSFVLHLVKQSSLSLKKKRTVQFAVPTKKEAHEMKVTIFIIALRLCPFP